MALVLASEILSGDVDQCGCALVSFVILEEIMDIRTALENAGLSEKSYVECCGPVLNDPVDDILREDLAYADEVALTYWSRPDTDLHYVHRGF